MDNIKPWLDNPEGLLFQVLVDLPIRRETIQNKTVFFVNHKPYDLIACFDQGITEELVKELAVFKPAWVVFRDNSSPRMRLKPMPSRVSASFHCRRSQINLGACYGEKK